MHDDINNDSVGKHVGDISQVILRENERIDDDIQALKSKIKRTWTMVFLIGGAAALLFASAFWIFPKYRFIPSTESICSITNPPPPQLSVLSEYAKDAVVAAYTYDYVNYRNTLNYTAAKYFTANGRIDFMKAIDEARNLELVIKSRMILRASPRLTPVVTSTWKDGGKNYWTVKVPIQIAFYTGGDADARKKQNFVAIVNVTQTPVSAENLKGIALDSLVLSPDDSTDEKAN